LPQYDNILLSHKDRSRIMGDRSFDADSAWKGSVLVDGFLAGAWRLRTDRKDALFSLELDPIRDRATKAAVMAEGERLLEFLTPDAGSRELRVVS
jgi:hypothetical protein